MTRREADQERKVPWVAASIKGSRFPNSADTFLGECGLNAGTTANPELLDVGDEEIYDSLGRWWKQTGDWESGRVGEYGRFCGRYLSRIVLLDT